MICVVNGAMHNQQIQLTSFNQEKDELALISCKYHISCTRNLRREKRLAYENFIIETLVLRPSKLHKKDNAPGGDKHCEGMHFN